MMNYALSKEFWIWCFIFVLFAFISCHALFLSSFVGFFPNFSLTTDGNWSDVSHNWMIFLSLNPKSDFKTFFLSQFDCHFLFNSIDSLPMNFCLRRLFWKYMLKWWIIFFPSHKCMTISIDFRLCVLGGAEEEQIFPANVDFDNTMPKKKEYSLQFSVWPN